MIETEQFNALVKKYNTLLHQNAMKGNDKEIVSAGETISIGDIQLSSNKIPIAELSDLLIKMLKNKTIKEYLDFVKVEYQKKSLTYTG